MTELLVTTPRWLLLAALIYAPWAYGGTRPWTVDVLNLVLGAIMILWLMGCAVGLWWYAAVDGRCPQPGAGSNHDSLADGLRGAARLAGDSPSAVGRCGLPFGAGLVDGVECQI